MNPLRLDPDLLARLENLELLARGVVEGFLSGRHRSPFRGFSVEYLDRRPYVPGDEIRAIDWRLLARTDEYHVKLFQEETNLRAYLLVDASLSMKFRHSGPVSKWEFARILAAVVSYLLLSQNDAVGLTVFDQMIREQLPPSSRGNQFRRIVQTLESHSPQSQTQLARVIHELSERVTRRGLVILIGDLIEDVPQLLDSLRHLRHRRHEIILFHILDSAEIDFPFSRACRFQAIEEAEFFVADGDAIRGTYQKRIQEWFDTLESGCHELRIDYHRVRTDESLDGVLAEFLARRGRMR